MMDELGLWFLNYKVNVSLSLAVIVLYFVLHGIAIPKLKLLVEKGALKSDALRKAVRSFSLLYGTLSLALVLFIWGFDFQWLLAVSSGIVALTGVALFASWSILSNITAFFILLFQDSFKRGNYIRVIEADNYVEGVISDITLFNTKLISDNREYIIYPNNLLIARTTIINPKTHSAVAGKIQDLNVEGVAAQQVPGNTAR